jgi:hypothetical protein
MGDDFKLYKAYKVSLQVECPRCKFVRPKANASKLQPGQRCRVCGYVDPRERPKQ